MKKTWKYALVALSIVVGLCLAIFLTEIVRYLTAKRPNFDGEITEVRVTAVSVNVKESAWPDTESIWVHYGYKMDGTWYDIPAENYELCDMSGQSVFDPLFKDHLVQIGPYVLISLMTTPQDNAVIFDTLGTKILTPLDQYYMDFGSYAAIQMYSKDVKPFYTKGGDWLSELFLSDDVTTRCITVPHYLVVPLDKIDSSYEITIDYGYYNKKTGQNHLTDTITGETILSILDN